MRSSSSQLLPHLADTHETTRAILLENNIKWAGVRGKDVLKLVDSDLRQHCAPPKKNKYNQKIDSKENSVAAEISEIYYNAEPKQRN